MATANIVEASISGRTSNALAAQGDGFILPKMATASRLALSLTTLEAGLEVYDITLNNLFIWNGSAWGSVPSSADTSNTQVLFNDNGTIAGSTDLVFDKTTGQLTATGDGRFNGVTIGKGFNSVSTNTAIGSGTLTSTQAGATNNTAGGINSQRYNTTGIGNTSFGSSSLSNLLFSGSSNVAVGYQAGSTISTGSSNILLGRSCATEAATSSNQICIGSTSFWVGTNGGPSTWWAGASGAIGYWRVIINGVPVKIPVYAD